MNDCYFCTSIKHKLGLDFIEELGTELFVAAWDINPVTPGHMLIIPKRHAQYMNDLGLREQENLAPTVIAAKKYLRAVNLSNVYDDLAKKAQGTKSEEYIRVTLEKLVSTNRPPESFNDGLNDGPAAGQTVPHFHWHIMPRWEGDVADPRGGIRHMFPGLGNYYTGIIAQDR